MATEGGRDLRLGEVLTLMAVMMAVGGFALFGKATLL